MKKAKPILTLALAMALALSIAGAGLAAGEAGFKEYTHIVDTPFVKDVVAGKVKGVIIDSRPHAKMYLKGHIPGALSLPSTQFDKKAGKVLPKDKSALLVFYCGGLKCALSHKGAYKSETLGYKNIKVYAKGMPAWEKAGGQVVKGPWALKPPFEEWKTIVNTAFVKEVAAGKKLGLIVDSRPKVKMFDKGHVPGSISMPFTQFAKMSGLLPADKNMLVVFYCGGLHCALSHKSAYAAAKLGYKNLAVYAEGYPAWKKLVGAGAAGLAPAPKKAAGLKRMYKQGREEGSMDHATFKKLLKDGKVMVVDVRDAGEFKTGTLKGAVNIPVEELEKKLTGWKPAKPVVFICGTGARSGEAYYMARDKRPDMNEVYFLDGELTIKKDGSYKLTAPK